MNGPSEFEGMVEVCVEGLWRSICDKSWNEIDASVTCGQLGYSPTGTLPHSYYTLLVSQ